jgi:hypothetical protein
MNERPGQHTRRVTPIIEGTDSVAQAPAELGSTG